MVFYFIKSVKPHRCVLLLQRNNDLSRKILSGKVKTGTLQSTDA